MDNANVQESLVGRFVYAKAGHDKGSLYIVIAEDKEFVLLSDGRLKPLERAKKKRRKHVQLTNQSVEPELAERLKAGDRVFNEEIKYRIKSYGGNLQG